MLSQHVPEPACDIEAQIEALLDPDHPKTAVFLSLENDVPELPEHVRVLTGEGGILLTTDEAKAVAFSKPNLTDADMAEILGYPESKGDVALAGDYVAVQALDSLGRVVTEMAASVLNIRRAIAFIEKHIPAGGELAILNPWAALSRRVKLVREQQKAMH